MDRVSTLRGSAGLTVGSRRSIKVSPALPRSVLTRSKHPLITKDKLKLEL